MNTEFVRNITVRNDLNSNHTSATTTIMNLFFDSTKVKWFALYHI